MRLMDLLFEEKADNIECQCGWSWKKSEGGKDPYICHKCGRNNSPRTFDEFAEKRLGGAERIAENSKRKGGPAMLTYHHFKVKFPYYKKAKEGKFDVNEAKKEFKNVLKTISLDMDQRTFQREVGRLEVLGELIIKHK
jgi:hypothetical protein